VTGLVIVGWFYDAAVFFGDALKVVDLITWDKGRIGMGYRSRRRGEYLIFLQKPPIRAKGTWKRSPWCSRRRLRRGVTHIKSRRSYIVSLSRP